MRRIGFGAVIVALLLAVLSLYCFRPDEAVAPVDLASVQTVRTDTPEVKPETPVATPAETSVIAPTAMETVVPAAEADGSYLVGIVVSPTSIPVVGASIRITEQSAASNSIRKRLEASEYLRTLAATTDVRGEFCVAVAAGTSYGLEISCREYPPLLLADCYAGEFVRAQMLEGGSVRVEVVRERDGGPVADALVRGIRSIELCSRRTDAVGEVAFGPIAPGPVTFIVTPEHDGAIARKSKVEVKAGEVVDCRVEVKAGVSIQGRVLDRETGAPKNLRVL